MCIELLRKQKSDETTYTRPESVSTFIRRSLGWSFDQLMERASILDQRNPGYVPSEALVYHLRQTKFDNSDGRFVALYNALRGRVEAACPRASKTVGNQQFENARLAEIRDAIVEHVTELMFTDRHTYNEQLDYYECRFNHAVRMLRITKFQEVGRKENPKEALYDAVTGDVRMDVEQALEGLKRACLSQEENLTYRIQVRREIDALPTDEQKVIDMLLTDIPIEATNDDDPSISKLLGCTEKTVRNRRDRAIAKIQKALNLEGRYDE